MAPLRTKQFVIATVPGTAVTNLYTVPAGKRIRLTSVILQEVSAIACTVQFRVNTIGTYRQVTLGAFPAGTAFFEWHPDIVFDTGQILQLSRSNAGQVQIMMAGYEFFI